MPSIDVEQIRLSGVTVEDVMNFKEEELDLLLEDIRLKIEKNRRGIERSLEEF
ncbi:MAG: hypothetical protein V3R82_02250 [Candidatus Hydrothermarchaeales archaeon]